MWIMWRKFWKLKSTATVEIKGILLTALWFSWSNMQYLSSNWVFGDWRQIWDSWRYFCVRQVSRSIYVVFRSVSLSNCVYNYSDGNHYPSSTTLKPTIGPLFWDLATWMLRGRSWRRASCSPCLRRGPGLALNSLVTLQWVGLVVEKITMNWW